MKRQFITLKLNPIRIDSVRDTGYTVDDLILFCKAKNPHPTPNNKLNDGPAKLAVVAISGIPFRAMATFAERSPREFPQARTVTPRIGAGIRLMVPRN